MFWLIPLVYSSLILQKAFSEEHSNLILVQALFRHGDRAPVLIYPTDPNKRDCWPEGLGKLTLLGKKQQYALGKYLRSMYKDFITTNPNEVFVTSTASDRCLTSAATTLASFYAPNEKWKVDDNLDWQPISIHYLPPNQDKILNVRGSCPRAEAEQKRKVEEIHEHYQQYQAKFAELSNFTGLNLSRLINVFFLHDTLSVEKKHNLTIPEWVNSNWEELEEIAAAIFQAISTSPLILRLRVGSLLQDISENMKKKINGDMPDLLVRLYSAHDLNVARVLLALNFTNMPRPPYCATLLFELHEMADASMAVRLLYMNSTDPLVDMEEPHVLVLDDCSEFCPVENFTKKFQHLIPENWEEECQVDTSDTSETHENSLFSVIQNDK